MKYSIFTIILFAFSTILSINTVKSQDENGLNLTQELKSHIITNACNLITNHYLFPEKGEEIAQNLQKNFDNGMFDSVNSFNELAQQLNEVLYSLSNDDHMIVRFDPATVTRMRNSEKSAEEKKKSEAITIDRLRQDNFGFKKVEILEQNIGYLDLRSFSHTRKAGLSAVSALNFLHNCNAIIIDLRNNGGGDNAMQQLVASYFIGCDDEIPVTTLEKPIGTIYEQYWTLPYVPGVEMCDKDLYLLTSERTFSAAEGFTDLLKSLNRAIVIGETTRGGAHGTKYHPLGDYLYIGVPHLRAINPINGNDWEGVGVTPHILIDEEKALLEAQIIALDSLSQQSNDERTRHAYHWRIDALLAEQNPIKQTKETLRKHIGKYGERSLFLEKGKLYYHKSGGQKLLLSPITNDYYFIEGIDYYRIRILKEKGEVIGIQGCYSDGRTYDFFKTK